MECKFARFSASLVLAALTNQAFASAFQLQEQNVTNLGLAYSGTAALAEDATTGYFNSAGLARICDGQVVLSGVLIQGSFAFTPTSVTPTQSFVNPLPSPFPPFVGHPMPLAKDDPARLAGVPTISVAQRLDDQWVLGFNINTPFGLRTQYDGAGVARYIATTSDLYTINVSPSISYQPWPCFAIGGGMDFEYGEAELDTFNGNGYAGQDGYLRNNADGWGYGWHLGILWEPFPCTRIGLNYRSKVNMHLEGSAEFYSGEFLTPIAVVDPLSRLNPPVNALHQVRAKMVLPETATFSFYQELSALGDCFSAFALTGDIAWTNWSRIHTLRMRYAPDFTVTNVINTINTDTFLHFKDSFRYALGLLYTYNQYWLFQCGVAYDETPTQDQYRSARIPDDNRYWVAVGAAFTPNRCWRFDLGYAHIFFDKPSINETQPYEFNTTHPIGHATLSGNYKPYANLVGIQMRYDFV